MISVSELKGELGSRRALRGRLRQCGITVEGHPPISELERRLALAAPFGTEDQVREAKGRKREEAVEEEVSTMHRAIGNQRETGIRIEKDLLVLAAGEIDPRALVPAEDIFSQPVDLHQDPYLE